MHSVVRSRGILFIFFLASFIFLTGRLHYFLYTEYQLKMMTSDGRWWWFIQNNMDDTSLIARNPFYKERFRLRFRSDLLLQEGLVKLAQTLELPLIKVNLLVTTILYLCAFLFSYVLGLALFRYPAWSFLFSIVVSQSAYSAWLRYPILVPKMIGFTLFPLVLCTLVRITQKGKGFLLFNLLCILSFLLYPASSLYYWSSLIISAFVVGCVKYHGHNRELLNFMTKLCGTVAIMAGVLILYNILSVKHIPVPLKIAEVYYKNHRFRFPKSLVKYCSTYGPYLILVLVATYHVWKKGNDEERFSGLLLMLVYVVMLFEAIVAHILAKYISLARMLWFWRVAYYSYIPGIAVIILGFKVFYKYNIKSRNVYFLSKLSPLVFLVGVVFITPPTCNNIHGIIANWSRVLKQKDLKRTERELEQLIHAARTTCNSSIFLLPYPKIQTGECGIFEAECKRSCLLSKNDKILLVVWSPLTARYYRALVEYGKIMQTNDRSLFSKKLLEFSEKQGASYILQPRQLKHFGSKLDLPVFFENSKWIIYSIKR